MDYVEFYNIFQAFKLHFTTKSYDFFKYNGKTNNKGKHVDNDKSCFQYKKYAEKLDNRHDAISFCYSTMVDQKYIYIKNMETPKYKEFIKRGKSCVSWFKNEIEQLTPSFLKNTNEDNYPQIIKLYYSEKISLETFILINWVFNDKILQNYDITFEKDVLWNDIRNKILKRQKFILYCWNFDDSIKKQLRDILNERLRRIE
jgi:hypothetical protein